MRNDVSGTDTLRHLFVLMIGLGMRESSGRYCEGRDQSASNTSARHRRGRAVPDELGRARRQPPHPAAARRVSGQRRRRLSRDLLPKASRRARSDLDNCGSGTGQPFPAAVQGAARFCGGDRGRRLAQSCANALGTHQPARGRASAGGRRHAPAGAAVDGGWPARSSSVPDLPVVPVCPCLRTTSCGCSSRSTRSAPTRRWPRTA